MSVATPQRVAGERFIDPVVLARIGNLELLARIVVQGFMSGLHRAMVVGASSDFAEYRTYSPGDDVRHVDWKLYGRTDRLYLKTFEAQTNADVMLVVDASGSMAYGDTPCSKFEYASFIAASLAWLGRSQRDRLGLALVDDSVRTWLAPSAARQPAMLHALHNEVPSGAGNIAQALEGVAARMKRRGVVVVISDFYDEVGQTMTALDALRAHGHEVIAIQVLADAERDLDLSGTPVLEDMETGELMPVVIAEVREQYRELLSTHRSALESACGGRGVDYVAADTGMPLDTVLYGYLSHRARRSKVR